MHDAQPLILDKVDYNSASADLCESRFGHTALWHVVTETVLCCKMRPGENVNAEQSRRQL